MDHPDMRTVELILMLQSQGKYEEAVERHLETHNGIERSRMRDGRPNGGLHRILKLYFHNIPWNAHASNLPLMSRTRRVLIPQGFCLTSADCNKPTPWFCSNQSPEPGFDKDGERTILYLFKIPSRLFSMPMSLRLVVWSREDTFGPVDTVSGTLEDLRTWLRGSFLRF